MQELYQTRSAYLHLYIMHCDYYCDTIHKNKANPAITC